MTDHSKSDVTDAAYGVGGGWSFAGFVLEAGDTTWNPSIRGQKPPLIGPALVEYLIPPEGGGPWVNVRPIHSCAGTDGSGFTLKPCSSDREPGATRCRRHTIAWEGL